MRDPTPCGCAIGSLRVRLTNIGPLLLAHILIGCITSGPTPAQPPAAQSAPTPQPTQIPSAVPSEPPKDCPHMPHSGFSEVWRYYQIWPRLGCAVAPAEALSGTEAYLACMHSLWLRDKLAFVAIPYSPRGWRFIPDESGLPPDAPLMLKPALRSELSFAANGRHGWLASQPVYLQACDGKSFSDEAAFEGRLQQFEHGWLLSNGKACFVLFDDGSWTMF